MIPTEANWEDDIIQFLRLCTKHNVQMIMVGGGAVNFHGYQRHSADVDFWLNTDTHNLENLKTALIEMGYKLEDFPETVKNQEQNISLKFSPDLLQVELITRFEVNKSFSAAYGEAIETAHHSEADVKWKVIGFEDLITSKIKSNRPKDQLDIQELRRIHKM